MILSVSFWGKALESAKPRAVWAFILNVGSIAGLLSLGWQFYIRSQETPFLIVDSVSVGGYESQDLNIRLSNLGRRTTTIIGIGVESSPPERSKRLRVPLFFSSFSVEPGSRIVREIKLDPGESKLVHVHTLEPISAILPEGSPFVLIIQDSFGTEIRRTVPGFLGGYKLK